MARSRGRCTCGYAGGYPPKPEEEFAFGEDEERDSAFKELSAALEALPDPVAACAQALSEDDVRALLEAVPHQERPRALRPLGLDINPQHVGRTLVRDVRGRLKRAAPHEQWHALTMLTVEIHRSLVSLALSDMANYDNVADTFESTSPAMRRVALWVWLWCDALGAKVIAEYAEHDSMTPPGAQPGQMSDLVAAARRVVALTDPGGADDTDGEPAAPTPEADEDRAPQDQAGGMEPVNEATPGTDEGDATDHPDTSPVVPTADLAAAVATLEDQMREAAVGATELASALGDGRHPGEASVGLVRDVLERFTALETDLAAAGVEVTDRSVTGMREALDLARARDDEQPLRERLEALTRLTTDEGTSPEAAAKLAAAAVEAEALRALPRWQEADRARAETLQLVVDLAEAATADDKINLQTQLVSADPKLALLAVYATGLRPAAGESRTARGGTRHPETEAPGTEPDAAETDSDQPGSDEPDPGIAETAAEQIGADAEEPSGAEAVTTEPGGDSHSAADESAPKETSAEVGATGSDAEATTRETAQDAEPTPADEPETAHGRAEENAEPADEVGAGEERADERAAAPAGTLEQATQQLLAEQRYAFAAHAVDRAGAPLRRALVEVCALAAEARTGTGPVADALRDRLGTDLGLAAGTAPLLLGTTALVRAALVTGDPVAGGLLEEASGHLPPRLAGIADEVARRASNSALMQAPAMTAVGDAAALERALAETQRSARAETRPRTLRYQRASIIANSWLEPDGFLGEALGVVVADDRDRTDLVRETADLLRDASAVSRKVDDADAQTRGNRQKAIHGAGRGDLVRLAESCAPVLDQWLDVTARLANVEQANSWAEGEVAAMGTAVLGAADGALAELAGAAASGDPWAAAAATAAHASLTETLALLQGTADPETSERPVGDVLGLDALHLAGADVDPDSGAVTVADDLDDLPDAVDRTWDDAARVHADDGNFTAARRLVLAADAGRLRDPDGARVELGAELRDHLAAAEKAAREEIRSGAATLGEQLRLARATSQVTEEQDAELTAHLDDVQRDGVDVRAARRLLGEVAAALPRHREQAVTLLRERLEELSGGSSLDPSDVAKVEDVLGKGDLNTAEEMIYQLADSGSLPEAKDYDELARFFPGVPDALERGITVQVVEAARSRGALEGAPAVDFSGISPEQASLAADALDAWRRFGASPRESRWERTEVDLLLPALRLAGIEGKRVTQIDKGHGPDRRFVDVTGVDIAGKAMVPAFGSEAGDRRRVLLAWGQPSPETLLSWVDQDPAEEPLIVAYFGTLSAAARADLAGRSPRSGVPVVVLDDAALAYLAACGGRRMDTTMRILLPFAHVNPYVREKRGLVPREMFYGREEELRAVGDPRGTQIIYGGRGLGKSALLKAAEARFEDDRSGAAGERVAVYLDLNAVVGHGPAFGAAALWDSVLEELQRRGVITRRGGGDAYRKVERGVQSWLEEDSSRRLLILLDESDRFFNADAPTFRETVRVRNLGNSTAGRCKVVFAGLHSVQRFSKVAENSPFSHLAQRPTVIGPLSSQRALDLLTKPMSAMGYTFEEPDLINRVLARCSYQPFLLQMFGHRLVERMHDQRHRAEGGAVPYVVTRADVDAVEENHQLVEDISNAFHETLDLDPRYNVIANVVALHAYEKGLDHRRTSVQLRDECLTWWHEGFARLDSEEFRAYLVEMVGLGILARDTGDGWRLRSPAVLRMMGTKSEVEDELGSAETSSLREDFVALEARRRLDDGRGSPLTERQLSALIGDRANQVRVVLGSTATGVEDAADAIRDAAKVGKRFEVPEISSRGAYERALSGGEAGERRVVVSDLRDLGPETCATSLQTALERVPTTPGVTRSAVIIAGPGQLPFWREVLSKVDEEPDLGVVPLRRLDAKTLQVWAMQVEKFRSPERQHRLLEVTGGWPQLVERVAVSATWSGHEDVSVDALEAHLATPEGAAELVAAVGLEHDEEVARGYAAVVDLVGAGEASLEDLEAAVEDVCGDASAAVACLIALGVTSADTDGQHRLEPVLRAAWSGRQI